MLLAPFLAACGAMQLPAAGLATQQALHAATAPNFVIILFDDMGFSDLGPYGSEIPTPNIDRLAAGGLRLAQFYNYARCSPSRAALLAGQYPHQVGMARNAHARGQPRPPGPSQGWLDADAVTLAESLKAAGYRSYMSGKWHLGEDRPNWPVDNGFDRAWGLLSGASGHFGLVREPTPRSYAQDGFQWLPPERGFYATTETGDRAEQFVLDHHAAHGAAPFFLYVAFTAPHFPLHALDEDMAAARGLYAEGWDVVARRRAERAQASGLLASSDLADRPASIPDWETLEPRQTWERRMEAYAAMIMRADKEVGDIISALERSGALDKTLILVMADNGGSAEEVETTRNLGEPGATIGARGSYASYLEPWARVSNAPFANYKSSVMEGGVRSPFIAHWPAGMGRTSRIDVQSWATLIDIAPTLNELAGLAPRSGEGVSLAPLLASAPLPERPPFFWEQPGWAAARMENWKIVRGRADAGWRLYDLGADPLETDDLAARHPARVADMAAAWDAWAARTGADQTQ